MNENNLKKFQDLLRTLFQFDCANLDFGIYRILNYLLGGEARPPAGEQRLLC